MVHQIPDTVFGTGRGIVEVLVADPLHHRDRRLGRFAQQHRSPGHAPTLGGPAAAVLKECDDGSVAPARRTPRRDTRGIVDPAALLRSVDFRRVPPCDELTPYVEHYWFIDWDLATPFEQHVVGHPSVNVVVMQATAGEPVYAEIAGVGRELFSIKLADRGWVRAAQFRPGGFRPFHDGPVSSLTDRHIAIETASFTPSPDAVAAPSLDALLLRLGPHPSEAAELAMRLADEVRRDRTLTRVADLADRADLSLRALQRLFLDCVGVSPKWVILRYRVQEAIERASSDVDWAALATELGYSDQAHLVRDVTATIGMPPAAYARAATLPRTGPVSRQPG
jgi:AraC-like DNA-binding protein